MSFVDHRNRYPIPCRLAVGRAEPSLHPGPRSAITQLFWQRRNLGRNRIAYRLGPVSGQGRSVLGANAQAVTSQPGAIAAASKALRQRRSRSTSLPPPPRHPRPWNGRRTPGSERPSSPWCGSCSPCARPQVFAGKVRLPSGGNRSSADPSSFAGAPSALFEAIRCLRASKPSPWRGKARSTAVRFGRPWSPAVVLHPRAFGGRTWLGISRTCPDFETRVRWDCQPTC